MIWLTWRQHRKQAFYTLIALAAVAVVMLLTGLAMHHTFTNSGLASCLAKLGTAQINSRNAPDCSSLSQQFSNQYSSMTFIGILFVILPVFVGIFFGAPLVAREVEAGTHRLVWTQGVSRRHWALVKFGLLGAVTIVLAAAYALGMTWWFGPLVTSGGGRLRPVSFDVQGIAPIGYTLFAVALGIFASTMWKKILPAMGVTLAGFAVVRVLIETLARPHYLSPLTASIATTSTEQFNSASGAWIYSYGVINAAGRLVMPNFNIGCAGAPGGNAAVGGAIPSGSDPCNGGLLSQGLGPAPFSNWQQYQPASRFWEFQGIETGIFLALSAILLYLAIRRIRRIS
jgi:ABC-type transport system involved in multi-copper enzyme maturation permease subunit